MSNCEWLKTLEPYELAELILNIGENPCDYCPREKEVRCNDDCDNGIVEWLVSEHLDS